MFTNEQTNVKIFSCFRYEREVINGIASVCGLVNSVKRDLMLTSDIEIFFCLDTRYRVVSFALSRYHLTALLDRF